MRAIVATATDNPADQANPKVDVGMAHTAFSRFVFVECALTASAELVLCVATDGTPTTLPLLQACTMENMLTDYRKQASGLIHAF